MRKQNKWGVHLHGQMLGGRSKNGVPRCRQYEAETTAGREKPVQTISARAATCAEKKVREKEAK